MRAAFLEAIEELAASDPRITLVVGDLGYSVVERFASRFPGQFLNAGVAEQNMTGVAAGLALAGRIVFTYSIANFPTLRCLEQVRNDVCYHRANVKIVSVGGGYAYGPLGFSHHATEDLAVMRALPEMCVVAPGDPWETSAAVRALAARPGPAYLRLGKSGEPEVHAAPPAFELGKALLVREGDAGSLLSTGAMLATAAEAVDAVAAEGLHVRLLSVHTLKPLDEDAVLRAAAETGAVVTLEEHTRIGGLGSAVADLFAQAATTVRFRQLALPDAFRREAGSQTYMRGRTGLGAAAVAAVLRAMPLSGPAR